MDFDDIDRMLERMQRHGLVEFELETEAQRVRLRKPDRPGDSAIPLAAPGDASVVAAAVSDQGRAELDVLVEAPILGTFYRASAPDVPAFVAVGDGVRAGDVLCIIEAMKLMNEIRSACDGEVVAVFVESGQPVQYGDRLFAIRPR